MKESIKTEPKQSLLEAERAAREGWRNLQIQLSGSTPSYRIDLANRLTAPKVWWVPDVGFVISLFRSTDEQAKRMQGELASSYDPDCFEWERGGRWA